MEKEPKGTESQNSVESEATKSQAEEKKQDNPETNEPQEKDSGPQNEATDTPVDNSTESEIIEVEEEPGAADSTDVEVEKVEVEVESSEDSIQEVSEEIKVEVVAEKEPGEEAPAADPNVDSEAPETSTDDSKTETSEAPSDPVAPEKAASVDKSDTEQTESDKQPAAKSSEDEGKPANEAADSQEEDTDDKSEHEDEYADEDFSKYTKSELVDVVKKLGKEDNPMKADKVLNIIAPIFNSLRSREKEEASKTFIAEGGDPNDFSFKPDELDLRFDANYRLIKDRRSNFIKGREQEKQSNLAKAEILLDKLREFVDSEESTESFDTFKALQNEWKAIGDVPAQQSKTLWANYNALIHRFYDQRSIYFELKELDRKKNYDAKVKLCERAEALDAVTDIRVAIKQLNELHYDFKHLGPVPRDLQEDLWQRFKAASDKIYEKRKDFVADLKSELKENLEKKEALAAEIQEFSDFNSDSIKDWNSSSKKILDIQKRWEAIGGLPKDKAKAVNKQFWSSFKSYFHNKKQFFKKLEGERENNLEIKEELVRKVEELKDSTDWHNTANQIKQLQKEWKETGPVPGKVRNEIYQKFKQACDDFFENRRKQSKQAEGEYSVNLKKKSEIIGQIEALAKTPDFEKAEIQQLCNDFNEIGFVPKKSIGKIKDRFREAVDGAVAVSTNIQEEEKETFAITLIAGDALKGGDADRFIYQKEQNLRRQIGELENNIALWTNNLEFFRHSKNADELRDEVNAKVENAREELNQLKRRLKAYRKL